MYDVLGEWLDRKTCEADQLMLAATGKQEPCRDARLLRQALTTS